MTAERRRLGEADRGERAWRRWGAYLSERQWGTVREDYSADGRAWEYLSHDAARSRAYRWGEDGIAGLSDPEQRLCWGLALWNGRDPILKERLFGLTGHEGNHGEDVKELYYYLDATPTCSYLEMLYKYPQAEFPYARLVEENRRRGRGDPEFELLDTGVFDGDRYFDVTVAVAKAGVDDLLISIEALNRGPQAAFLALLPQLWFRNTWSWGRDHLARPSLAAEPAAGGSSPLVAARHPLLPEMWLSLDGAPEILFCENETNVARLFGAAGGAGPFKDGIHDCVVHGVHGAVAAEPRGTKMAAVYRQTVPAGGSLAIRLRFSAERPESSERAFADFAQVFAARRAEADEFYAELAREAGIEDDAEARRIARQAYAGLLWSRQYYHYDVSHWLEGDPAQPPPPPERKHGRNSEWFHLNNSDVLSMPDAWEYPWYAAWDLAFHCIPLARLDPEFAKGQLVLLAREWYMHPNGQLPAYEWAFGDVNPPVHAWAALRVFEIDRAATGRPDHAFLERVFHKLMLNFTWWVNRKDVEGKNVFQGGFLGLDNIGVFDRSATLPTGGQLAQADGTSWMATYCLSLLRVALELAVVDRIYEDIATKFFEHFLYIAGALKNLGSDDIDFWDEEDDFIYDVLRLPDGRTTRLKVRSMVGLIPLFAVEILDAELLDRVPDFKRRLEWFLDYRPDLASLISRWHQPGKADQRLLSLLRGHRMKCLLRRMLDETEFLSPWGVRALSRYHLEHPYVLAAGGRTFTVSYQPGESESGLFGGNSNWRGPVWFPVNYLIVESLCRFHAYYGDDFKIECPTGSGRLLTLKEAAAELARRLVSLFLPDDRGLRPVLGYHPKLQGDPHFRDHLLFHEYFHGDNGRGVGASHQTGWTALVTELLRLGAPDRPAKRDGG
ncbi:MAG TPA: glucosidase [Thermoanaerobaculia bacterium]